MSWLDVLVPIGTALLGGVGGALLGRHLKGKPPASRSAWKQTERDAKAKRDAKSVQ